MVAIKSIGRVLKERRTEMGLGLSEAESFTNIQKLYIVALETDDYKVLPGEFYVRAYLKQYAEKLGLDAEKILAAYEEGKGITVEDIDDIQETYRFVKPRDRVTSENEEQGPKTWRYYVPIIVLSAAAIAILGTVILIVLLNRPSSPDLLNANYTYSQSTSKKVKRTSSSASSSTSSSSSTAKKTEKLTVTGSGSLLSATLENATSPVKVTFTAGNSAKVWILVRNSNMDASGSETGITVSSQTPTYTATINDTATQSIITLGNHDNLTMTINGHAIDLSQFSNTGGPYTVNLTINRQTTTQQTVTSGTVTSSTTATTSLSSSAQ